MCLRDQDGDFVLAKTLCFTRWCPMNVSEALGLFHALEWLSDMQSDNIDFVLDIPK
jgi:ribonuclease HI